MMSFCRKWCWVMIGAAFSIISLATYAQQTWQMDHLSTEAGLSQGMIYSILQSYFTRVFKKETGKTPMDWRNTPVEIR